MSEPVIPQSMATAHEAPPHSPSPTFREMATSAIRYWEPRRLIYNAALAAVVAAHFLVAWPVSRLLIHLNSLLFLFVLAVLANVCYCAAYIVDLFAQFSGFRTGWLRWRGVLLALGILFAAVVTHFTSMGVVPSGPGN